MVFVAITHMVGFFIYLIDEPNNGGAGMVFLSFGIWCIFILTALGIYFYLGTVNYLY